MSLTKPRLLEWQLTSVVTRTRRGTLQKAFNFRKREDRVGERRERERETQMVEVDIIAIVVVVVVVVVSLVGGRDGNTVRTGAFLF